MTVHPHSTSWPELPAGIVLPGKDAPILQAAINAQAVILLTGDMLHFGRYYGKIFVGVRILPPGDFLRDEQT
ncbi:MAG: hypothetical protein HY343_03865 [Lentisphaerae bacterium]|nr:hypothetical protein [Lentisphaerota bacterium]